ncbi:hypothetical protein FEK30_16455 (plasmid) [Picosynechococcus sp. PCC 11901]|uniref:hypothetical protein n=1 Tax=Picosynechococcus sp. PCC 11901 TaxID=2579791 RepID=UPI0010FC2EC6|nr:hypothetical protein [Picosynechococcus sp. PCC 11901]QCS51101.1 hypothetical protein FEK30_16455 [Picosynechococcus sp. PCC 11901]
MKKQHRAASIGLQLLAVTCPVLFINNLAIAQSLSESPQDVLNNYLLERPPLRTIQFQNLQDIQARRHELQFQASDGVTLDFLPYLQSPGALPQLANIIRTQGIDPNPQLTVAAYDFADRLIILQRLEYQGSALACDQRGEALTDLGILCFNRQTKPRTLQQPAPTQNNISTKITEIRGKLNQLNTSPINGYTLSQLRALPDDELLQVALNNGRITEETYLMVPKVQYRTLLDVPFVRPNVDFTQPNFSFLETSNLYQPIPRRSITSNRNLPLEMRDNNQRPNFSLVRPQLDLSQLARGDRHTETHYLVNGFTWGSGREWRHRIGDCIDLFFGDVCVYAEPYASLGYGLGLRIPLQLDLTVDRTIQVANNQLTAFSPTVDLTPIDGNANTYQAAGIPSDQIFGGQEIVAEVQGTVGVRCDLEVWSCGNNRKLGIGVDLTDYLSSGGNMTPPAPGQSFSIGEVWSPDVTGGTLNYGIVGATFHLGSQLNMVGQDLEMLAQFPPVVGPNNGTHTVEQFPATYQPLVFNNNSFFRIYEPTYQANWNIIPGMKVKAWLGVDIGVAYLGAKTDRTWWFEDLSIESPNFTFTSHADTTTGYNIQVDHDNLNITAF